jgi:hypothetical protein
MVAVSAVQLEDVETTLCFTFSPPLRRINLLYNRAQPIEALDVHGRVGITKTVDALRVLGHAPILQNKALFHRVRADHELGCFGSADE